MMIRNASIPEEIPLVQKLFREYALRLRNHLCLQSFDTELAILPGDFASPKDRLLVAFNGEHAVGCVALRPIEAAIAEMKRLYVQPAFRDQGIGRELVFSLLREATEAGY